VKLEPLLERELELARSDSDRMSVSEGDEALEQNSARHASHDVIDLTLE
jgi:hypothetical protein